MISKFCPLKALRHAAESGSGQKLTRSETKRLTIIDAAKTVFLDKGFDIASMDMIAAEANVSKRTVYSHFKSKEVLFSSIMTEICLDKREEVLGGQSLEDSPLLTQDIPLEEGLTQFGNSLLVHVFDPEAIALMRIVVGQAENFPEIGEEFYNQGPTLSLEILTAYFKKLYDTGKIQYDPAMQSPGGLADSFLTSLIGFRHVACLVNAQTAPSKEEIEIQVTSVVQLFAAALAPKK